MIASLDQVSAGRIGWNMVTGSSDVAARNYGLPALPEHDLRYDRAEEFMQIVKTDLAKWSKIVKDSGARVD